MNANHNYHIKNFRRTVGRCAGEGGFMSWQRSRQKYHAKKVIIDGVQYDSKREAARAHELSLLESAGEIRNLQRQVRFLLIPAQYEPDITTKTGKKKRGRLIERKCEYVADFCYFDRDGRYIVEDVKGIRTEVYKIKRKLMLYNYGVRIVEV